MVLIMIKYVFARIWHLVGYYVWFFIAIHLVKKGYDTLFVDIVLGHFACSSHNEDAFRGDVYFARIYSPSYHFCRLFRHPVINYN